MSEALGRWGAQEAGSVRARELEPNEPAPAPHNMGQVEAADTGRGRTSGSFPKVVNGGTSVNGVILLWLLKSWFCFRLFLKKTRNHRSNPSPAPPPHIYL